MVIVQLLLSLFVGCNDLVKDDTDIEFSLNSRSEWIDISCNSYVCYF